MKLCNIPTKWLGERSHIWVALGCDEAKEAEITAVPESEWPIVIRASECNWETLLTLEPCPTADLYLDAPVLGVLGDKDGLKELCCTSDDRWGDSLRDMAQLSVTIKTCATNGWLPMLKWKVANGGKMTQWTAVFAAENGHLKVLQWIVENGGKITHRAADHAAKNGHLEVLKWIIANGGEMTSNAMNWAAINGYLEVLQWIIANGGEMTLFAADFAAKNGHLEVLQWIVENGGKMTHYAADFAAKNGHLEVVQWIKTKENDFTY